MKTNKNPWLDILQSSKKRCIKGPDIYWYVDENESFCLRFENVEIDGSDFNGLLLAGIDIIIIDTNQKYHIINLKLIDKSNWELFYFLCCDFIEALSVDSPLKTIKIRSRLIRWIELWKQNRPHTMSLIAQMNLFSELVVLFDIVGRKRNLEFAIRAWRGPEKDKQDFDLTNMLLEVKSFLSTSKKTLKISSAEQLTVRNIQILLISLQLSQSKNGISISEIIEQNSNLLMSLPFELNGLFYSKLFELGYSKPDDAPIKFEVKETLAYEIRNNFPCIKSTSLPDGIDTIQYEIKINSIEEFLIDFNTIIQ